MELETPEYIKFFISKFRELAAKDPDLPRYYKPRPYRNAAVKFRHCALNAYEDRYRLAVEQAHLNVFKFPAHKLPGCDLLSDSGTTTMTMEQWSQMLLGDEAYGSNEGYYELNAQIAETFGEKWKDSELLIFHQGRACEHALFKVLRDTLRKGEVSVEAMRKNKSGYIIPSNGHFDTTEANIKDNEFQAPNLFCGEYYRNDPDLRFKGNIHIEKLERMLAGEEGGIPLIYFTITNNTGGGQPVSMDNIRAVHKLSCKYKAPFFFDAARFAENAWFIKRYEAGFQTRTIAEIVKEMFTYVDGFHISCKKDGLVNIGGALVIMKNSLFTDNYPHFLDRLMNHQLMTEAHPTYGGLAGRDLKGLVEGFKTVVRQEYLDYRIGQVHRFGRALLRNGIPILTPIGGSAVYIDIDKFFKDVPDADSRLKGISLTGLLLIAGHRLCELGIFAFGSMKDGVETPPEPRVNFVRAAVPRLVYEDQDLSAAAEAVTVLYDNRDRIPGVKVTHGQDLTLRHFKADFEFVD